MCFRRILISSAQQFCPILMWTVCTKRVPPWTRCGRSMAPPPSHEKKSENMCFLSSLFPCFSCVSLILSSFSVCCCCVCVLLCVRCCVVCEGIGGRNQPLDGSICLSPQEAQCNERFARQYRYEPPLEIIIS